jgi:phospholipid/cholesterol/gamma-HCH transport system substrate-binding protein
MMETKANYVLIGAFTIAISIFGLLFALWAANWSSEREWKNYRVVFNEAVTGLFEGGSVRYNGISVGTIQRLRLAPNDPRKVIAEVRISVETPIKTDTHAKISQDGLTGPTFIQLTGGSPNAPLLASNDRDVVPTIATEPSALQNIADTANRLVTRMDEVLSEQNVRRISDSLDNIEKLTGAVASQKEDLSALIVNAREVSEQLKVTLDTTNGTVERLDRDFVRQLPQLVDKLDKTLVQLESVSSNANAMIAENRAPLANFSQNGLQQVGPALSELRSLVRDLRRVASRLDSNPAGYVLGRQQPKEFVPE